MQRPLSLAIVVSHPIQYFAPWHRELARRSDVRLKVFFSTDYGVRPHLDEGFGREFAWDIPLMDGYEHEFLPRRRPAERLTVLSVDNPGAGEALQRFGPEVVLIHGYAHRLFLRVARWCRDSRVPLMLYSDSNPLEEPRGWKRLVKRAVVGRLYASIDGAFCMGRRNRDYHASYGLPEERLFAGMLPADTGALLGSVPDLRAARVALRTQYGLGADEVVVVLCGKLSPGKRPGDLLDAVARLRADGLPVRALFVGDGELRGSLEAQGRSLGPGRPAFAGFVNVTGLGAHYAASDILAFCSEFAAYGLVVTEAGALSLPAVVSDRVGCVGADDTARPGENVLVYRCGDVADLAGKLAALARDPGLRARMGARAQEIAATRTPERAAEALARAAAELAARGPRRRDARIPRR